MDRATALADRARRVIDTNRYLTLGTTEPDHRPRLSPVYYTHAGYRSFYWVSSPDARHSTNVAARPAVALVIFDSTAAIGQGRAVYLGADATMVPDDELPAACVEAYTPIGPDGIGFGPDELSGDADLRLYRARVTSYEVHVPGGDPEFGAGIDARVAITL